jgi:hypothetical protein
MKTRLGDIPARELVDELVRRLGVEETCRVFGGDNPVTGKPVSDLADLYQLADELDRYVR